MVGVAAVMDVETYGTAGAMARAPSSPRNLPIVEPARKRSLDRNSVTHRGMHPVLGAYTGARRETLPVEGAS